MTNYLNREGLKYFYSQIKLRYPQTLTKTPTIINDGTPTSGRCYEVFKSGDRLYVNVPWVDTDTNTWRPIGVGPADAAAGNHNHDKVYSKIHDHPYAAAGHNHDTVYSKIHSHPYAAADHTHNYAAAGHSHQLLVPKNDYTFNAADLPDTHERGLTCAFVNQDSGYGGYGTVLNCKTYIGGSGGTLQLYTPYSPTYGGTRLKARFGNYDVNNGNSWTDLKEIAWLSDINWNQIIGKPVTFPPQSHSHSEYAAAGHTHNYAAANHDHDKVYSKIHDHPYASSGHKQAWTAAECVEFTDDSNLGVTAAAVRKAIQSIEPKSHTHNYQIPVTVKDNVLIF